MADSFRRSEQMDGSGDDKFSLASLPRAADVCTGHPCRARDRGAWTTCSAVAGV